jgi:Glycosyl transferase family 2
LIHAPPRVTILLPTHNRADVLGYAIQSVLGQTERDFELLIVGDGCTDNTRDVISTFADPRIQWFDLPKAPLSGYANRNIALRQARGRYVAYAQHDDIMFPDHVERLIASIDASGADWAYSRPLWVAPDGVVFPFSINLTLKDELEHFLDVENHVPSTCVMHTRSALERVHFWPEDIARLADWRCWQRMILTSASGAAGHCRVPTALHFRANWKEGDNPLERRLRDLAESPWWPANLRHTPVAEPEQATIWRAIEANGTPWIAELRASCDVVIDRIAWMAERDVHPRIIASLEAQAKAKMATETARAETDALRVTAETARAEIDALRASNSWRITAPLRSIARRLGT